MFIRFPAGKNTFSKIFPCSSESIKTFHGFLAPLLHKIFSKYNNQKSLKRNSIKHGPTPTTQDRRSTKLSTLSDQIDAFSRQMNTRQEKKIKNSNSVVAFARYPTNELLLSSSRGVNRLSKYKKDKLHLETLISSLVMHNTM